MTIEKTKIFIGKHLKEVLITLFMFLLFFSIYHIVPMMFDGWAGKFYYPDTDGIFNYILYIIGDYYKWINGRISSNIICGFLESFSSEIPLDLFNTSLIIGIYVIIYLILKDKGKNGNYTMGLLLFSALILRIPSEMRKEVLFYANTAYVMPIFLIVLFYYFYQKFQNSQKPDTKKYLIIMSIISFLISTWMEHIAVGFTIVLGFIFLINIIKKDKKGFLILIPTAVSALGNLIMFLAPGLRTSRVIVNTESSIFEIVSHNISLLYFDLISKNLIIFIILFIFSFILIIKNKKLKKVFKFLLLISFIFLIITLILRLISSVTFLPYNFNNLLNYIYPIYSCPSFCLMILMLILILGTLLSVILISENRNFLTYLYFIALFSLAPMCLTPNTGARISSVGFFLLACITIIIMQEITKKTKVSKTVMIVTCFFVIFAFDKTILLGRRIYQTNSKRERIIENVRNKQELNEWDYSDFVILPLFEEDDILQRGQTSINSFHYPQFLKAYGLDSRTKVLFSNNILISSYSYRDGSKIKVEVINNDSEIKEFML